MATTMTSESAYASPAHEAFRTTKFFGSLDGLRCLSILAVIWHHTASPSFDTALSGRGNHGVTLFFAISGFLITTLLLRERDKTGGISLSKFYIRRSLRIFPLYYGVLGLYVVLVLIMERGSEVGDAFMGNLPAYLTYTSNWFVDLDDDRVIFYFAWSLATEEQFYLFWPITQKYTKGWTPVVVMSVLLVISILASYGYLGLADGFLLTVLTSFAPGICLGAIMARLLHDKRTFPILARVLGHKISSPLFLAAFLAYLALPAIDGWVVHVLGVLLVGASVCREDHFLSKPFQLFPIRWMGTISYGMYMLHMLAKNAYGKVASALGLDTLLESMGAGAAIMEFVATTLAVIIAATLSFKYYEAFFNRQKERFTTAR